MPAASAPASSAGALALTPAVYQLPLDDAATGPSESNAAEARDWSEPLLRENAIWFCQLRWIVVACLATVGVAGFVPEALAAAGLVIRPARPLGTAALLAVLNAIFWRLAHASAKGAFPPVRLLLWTQIVSDLLILTAVVHWVDNDLPAAPFMYLFHLILACIVFTPGESLLVAVLAAGFYLAGLALETAGVFAPPSVLARGAAGGGFGAGPISMPFLVVPMLLIWAVIWYLASRLAGIVRHRDRALAMTNRRLLASSEERARHMLQTTHQLKAPFAAIHAQTQLLLGGYCGELPAPARATAEKISIRCLALARQIQEMLQLANLRSQGQVAPPLRELNLAGAIEDVIARIEPTARQRGIRIEKQIEPVSLTAVPDHLTMLLDNLVVNAVSYSHDGGLVQVTARAAASSDAEVVVRDQGIGIPQDKLPRIFEDYYRTDEAVKHNRSSTGLGLAVVRQVAREMSAAILVESAPGWGTRFTVRLPRKPPVSQIPQPQPH
jgi:two-component system, OmpR family, phosphate regulon sensor histidine kinase PhoR